MDRPDVLIVEGLNVLPGRPGSRRAPWRFASDFLDFTMYVDADECLLRQWYVERFLALRATALDDPSGYFHRYASLSRDEAVRAAAASWEATDGPNLRRNILPTRERAHLILEKGADHVTRSVRLRKL